MQVAAPPKGSISVGWFVGLVFEKEQPGLRLAVHLHGDLYRAGVDLLALVQFGKLPLRFQDLGRQGADVHEIHRFGAAQFLSLREIILPGFLKKGIFKAHAVNSGEKGGVAAVV